MAFERGLALELVKRTVFLLVSLVLVLTFVFASFFIMPGDPVAALVPRGGDPSLQYTAIDELRLNSSIPEQYANFIVRMLSGEFFTSTGVMKHADLKDFIYEPTGRTLLEFVVVLFSSVLLGMVFGRILSHRPRSVPKRLLELVAVLAFVVPPALIAERFAISTMDTGAFAPETMRTVGMIIVVIVCVPIASCGYMLVVRSAILERLSPALDRRSIGHVRERMPLRGLLPSLTPLTHAWLAWTMACVLLAEIPTSSGGLGSLTWDAILTRDFPALMVCIFLVSLIVLLGNFVIGLVFLLGSQKRSSAPAAVGASGPSPVLPSEPSPAAQAPENAVLGLGRFWSEYRKSISGIIASLVLLAIVIVAATASLLATVEDPNDQESREPNIIYDVWINPLAPSSSSSPYTGLVHFLGTDAVGRDVYSMLLYGIQDFVLMAFGIVAVSLLIGTLMWAVAAELAKRSVLLARIGAAMATMVIDAIIAIPLTFIGISRLAIDYETSFAITFFASGVVVFSWAVVTKKTIADLSSARSGISAAGDRPLDAHRTDGHFTVSLLKGLVQSLGVTKFVVVIGLFSMVALEFMGLGDPGTFTLGNMLESAFDFNAMLRGAWWTYVPAAMAIVVTTASIYVLIDRIEEALRRMTSPAATSPALVSPSSSSHQAP